MICKVPFLVYTVDKYNALITDHISLCSNSVFNRLVLGTELIISV